MNEKEMLAIRRAATRYTDSRKRWRRLAQTGATDEEIVAELNRNFGLGGGSSGGWGELSESHKGKPPRVWLDSVGFGENTEAVSGKLLIIAIRYIFNIDAPGQLRPF